MIKNADSEKKQTDIVVMVLHLMHVQNFHGQTVAGVKILFLELVIVLLCMLIIIKKKIS